MVAASKAKVKEKAVPKEELRKSNNSALLLFYGGQINKSLDAIEKRENLTSSIADYKPLSSGILVYDSVCGGGLYPGCYVSSGLECSAKSTGAMETLGSAINCNVPLIEYHDPENAIRRRYTSSIIGMALDEVLGKKDLKGNWEIPPRMRLYRSSVLERVLNSIHRSIQLLPDKTFRKEDQTWYVGFTNTTESKNIIAAAGLKHEPRLFSQTNMYWCPIDDDGSPQGIFFIDSLANLFMEAAEDEDNKNNSIGQEARGFSQYMKRLKGYCQTKGTILYCINQLREQINLGGGAKRGGPSYKEYGGNSIRFNSDVRNTFKSIAVPDGWPQKPKKSGKHWDICQEPSAFNLERTDEYMFKSITNVKNKLATPQASGDCRIWIGDHKGNAQGFDEVFDTYELMRRTKMLTDTNKGIIFSDRLSEMMGSKSVKALNGATRSWMQFKTLILSEIDYLKGDTYDPSAKKLKLRGSLAHYVQTSGLSLSKIKE